MKFLNNVGRVLVLVAFIGCSQASTPIIRESSGNRYSVVNEDFFGTVSRFHIIDPDTGDRIKVTPRNDFVAQYFNIVLDGGGNDVWVNVTVKKPLDRETLGSSVRLQLLITDSQHMKLPCNKTAVYTHIHASDEDMNANGMVRYAMTAKVQSNAAYTVWSQTFSIDPRTGHVSLNACLDYEKTSYYQFTVTAQDAGSDIRLTSTTELVILVKDVIDESAFITG